MKLYLELGLCLNSSLELQLNNSAQLGQEILISKNLADIIKY